MQKAKIKNDSKSRTPLKLKGKIFVFSGPSGAGKTTLADVVLKDFDFFKKVVTYTTRPIREGEVDGVSYNFVSKEKFESFIKNDELMEYASVYGNYYGSLKSDFEKIINSGKSVLIGVDVQGALTFKKKFPKCVSIFIKTPTLEVLRERLLKRGKDLPEVIERRVKMAKEELPLEKKFTHIVVNDDLAVAVKQTKKIILDSLKK